MFDLAEARLTRCKVSHNKEQLRRGHFKQLRVIPVWEGENMFDFTEVRLIGFCLIRCKKLVIQKAALVG